jgi:O-antigen/teichoic acid export membrane protein
VGVRDISFGVEALKGFSAKVLIGVLGFVGSIVFARVLGPAGFGGFYLMISVLRLALRPLGGVHEATKKRVSEADTDSERVFGGLVVATVAIAGGLVAGAFVFAGPFNAFTGLDDTPLLFAAVLLPLVAFMTGQVMLEGTGRFGTAELVDLVRSVLTLPAQLGLVLLGWGPAGMAAGLGLATALTAPLSLRLLGVGVARPTRETFASLYEYAKFSALTQLLGKARERFDIILIGVLLSQAAAGQYEVAFKLTMPAMFVAQAVGSGLLARTSNADSVGDDVTTDVRNTMAFTSVFAVPMLFGAAAIARPMVVTIYGGEYAPAATLLVWLAAYRVVDTQLSPVAATIAGLDRPELNTVVSGVSLVANVALGVVLAFEFGALGIVVATVVTTAADYLVRLHFLRRLVPSRVFPVQELSLQLLSAAVMGAIVFTLREWFPVRGWLELVILISVGAAVYGLVLTSTSRTIRVTIQEVISDIVDSEK